MQGGIYLKKGPKDVEATNLKKTYGDYQENFIKLRKRGILMCLSNDNFEPHISNARKLLRELVSEQTGYKSVIDSDDSVLLADEHNNLKMYSRSWSPFSGQYIHEYVLKRDDIKTIELDTYPPMLADSIGQFALAGGLMYGVAGLAIGAFIDAIKGPKREDILIRLAFHPHSFPVPCYFTLFYESNVSMIEKNITRVFGEIVPAVKTVKVLFPDLMDIHLAS